MMANIAESAKNVELKPYSRPIVVARAVTAAEWELGMPPVLVINEKSTFLVAIKAIGTLTSCATIMAEIASRADNYK
ncbi:hypothetical protein JCM19038_2362 [Geomicrobium sp. JCM 19038]|nr:hypothetical protein JCM19038_2362 [Geomicrobium sp. JCM 19038]